MKGREGKRFIQHVAEGVVVDIPGVVSPLGRWLCRSPFAAVLRLLFRPTLSGMEKVPEDRGCLVVANHSGGGGIEIFLMAILWHTHFDFERPFTGMAHPLAFYIPGPKQAVEAFGAVPSSYEAGLDALERGLPVLIFPGGDRDAFRPVWEAKRVKFNGRKGFLKLARSAHVPILPLGIRGSHYTVPVLWSSGWLSTLLVLPRLLGLKLFPLTLLGALGAALLLLLAGPHLGYGWAALLAYLWVISPLSLWLPIVPWRVEAAIGDPIPPEELFGPRGTEGPLEEAYQRVVGEVWSLSNPDAAVETRPGSF